MRFLPAALLDLALAIDVLYAESGKGTGCCLHVTVDDYNIDDRAVDFCVKTAEVGVAEHGETHAGCLALAVRLRALTKRERAILLDLGWCPACRVFAPYTACCHCRGRLVSIPDDAE